MDETKVNGLLRLYAEAADREARLHVIGLLVENLKRGNAWLQITHPAAVPRLKEFAIAAADTDIQLRAVDALARAEGDKGLRALTEVFDRATDAKIRQVCITKLGERQSRLAADKLLQAARTDSDPTTRQAAVQALSRISAQVE